MTNQFNSGSGEDKSHLYKARGKKSINYKEQVTSALMERGVPLRVAELAVIDLPVLVNMAYHLKKTPGEAAEAMMKEVVRVYQRPDGSWPYTK